MIKKYNLNEEILPTIPTPHDFYVEEIQFNSEFLTFKLNGSDINYTPSEEAIHQNSKFVIMKIHLIDPLFEAYKWKKSICGSGFFEIDNKKLKNTLNKSTEYLYHYVAYNSIIVKLWNEDYYILDISADFVELEWL